MVLMCGTLMSLSHWQNCIFTCAYIFRVANTRSQVLLLNSIDHIYVAQEFKLQTDYTNGFIDTSVG